MESGYLFVRRIWGNGYATEAALAFKNYGFEKMQLRKMVSLIDVKNIPSTKVAERVGMKVKKTINK
jgi:RimJ/RimL family protein N-acetyltransferase